MFPQTKMSNPLFCDSRAVISAVVGSRQSKRSEQYHREISYLKDQVNAGYVHMRYCETKYQCADIFTKVLDRQPFEKHRRTAMNLPGGSGLEKALAAARAD